MARIPTIDDSLTTYMNEIGRIPLLDAADERRLGRRVRAGLTAQAQLSEPDQSLTSSERADLVRAVRRGEQAAEQFVAANLRLVISIAKKYPTNTSMTLADLVQEGNLGLIRAVSKFDPEKGFKFSTYATWWIRQAIGRGIDDQSQVIRVPGAVAATIRRISHAQTTLEAELGRPPTIEELGEKAVVAPKDVRSLLGAASVVASLDQSLGEDEGSVYGDTIADDADTALSAVDLLSAAALYEDIARLSDQEQEILVRRFGLAGHAPQTLDAVAACFPFTRERVRQIERKAVDRLRKMADARVPAA